MKKLKKKHGERKAPHRICCSFNVISTNLLFLFRCFLIKMQGKGRRLLPQGDEVKGDKYPCEASQGHALCTESSTKAKAQAWTDFHLCQKPGRSIRN